MRLRRDTSQLLVIDIQEKLLPAVEDDERVIETSSVLLRAARRLDIPTTLSEQYPQGLGPTVQVLSEEAGNTATTLPKIHFSCMGDDSISKHLSDLRSTGRTQIVVAGIEAHICVAQSVIDLREAGFDTFVVADAVSSRHDESWEFALDRMQHCGAHIVDTEMVVYEWLEKAGTPEFKELQELMI